MPPASQFYSGALDEIRKSGRYRKLRTIEGAQGPEVVLDGRRVICMCSNNYLGLAGHPAIVEAFSKAAREFGVGAGASRLISGNMKIHETLEERIAQFKGAERALVFNSGYHANTGVIPALVGQGDYIYSDALNHASIIDGARLSRATIRIYPHLDIQKLSELLHADGRAGRKLIVTDSVFSMDGDIAPLADLVKIKNRHSAMLMIDEAHATGVIGPGGRGLASALNVSGEIDVTMGTLGKALGCFGAFVCGSSQLIEYLINTARSFIFTTAIPPANAAAAIAALDVLEAEPERIARLHGAARYLRNGLKNLGHRIDEGEIPIIPLVIGDEVETMQVCERLIERGVFVQGIRPPTVPVGASRLRIAVMSEHTREHLDRALGAIRSSF